MVDISQELKLDWDSALMEADLVYEDGDLSYEQGIATAAVISLFTDRRALDDDELPDSRSMDKRGWWGDLGNPDVEDDQIGSRLWLLERSKTTEQTLVFAKQYTEEALQWIIDDGLASEIEVNVERQGDPGNDRLAIQAIVTLTQGTQLAIRIEAESTYQQLSNFLYMGTSILEFGDGSLLEF